MLLLELIQLPAQRSGRAQHYDGDDRDNSGQHGRLRLRAADEVPAERQSVATNMQSARRTVRLTMDALRLDSRSTERICARNNSQRSCASSYARHSMPSNSSSNGPSSIAATPVDTASSAMCSLAVLCGDLDKLSSYRFVWNVTEPALALGKNLRPRRPSPPREIGKLRRIEGTVLLVNAGNHVTF